MTDIVKKKAVAVYLTDEEKLLLEKQASQKGLSNSSYLRQIIFEHFKEVKNDD